MPTWARSIAVTLWGLVSLALVSMAVILAAPFLGARRSFWTIGPKWARMIFKLLPIRHCLTGWDELPEAIRTERQPVIFMSNHESNLDPPMLLGLFPIPAVFLAKKEVKRMGPVGWAAMLAGTIFIDRGNRVLAMASLRQAAREIQAGKSVILFPEGSLTPTGQLLPFKKGGFYLAQEAKVPIVPLATVGGFELLPRGAKCIRSGTLVIAFGAPVHPQDFPTREALMLEVRSRIEQLQASARVIGQGMTPPKGTAWWPGKTVADPQALPRVITF